MRATEAPQLTSTGFGAARRSLPLQPVSWFGGEERPLKRRRLSEEPELNTKPSRPLLQAHPSASVPDKQYSVPLNKPIPGYPATPDPSASPPPRPRRLNLAHKALPELPPLPDAPMIDVKGYEDPVETDQAIAEMKRYTGYPQTSRERIWWSSHPWYGKEEPFLLREEDGSTPPPLVRPAHLRVPEHEPISSTSRWRNEAPEMDLQSYNPPRPSGSKSVSYTHAEYRAWLIRREQCPELRQEWREPIEGPPMPYERGRWTKGVTVPLEETLWTPLGFEE